MIWAQAPPMTDQYDRHASYCTTDRVTDAPHGTPHRVPTPTWQSASENGTSGHTESDKAAARRASSDSQRVNLVLLRLEFPRPLWHATRDNTSPFSQG